MAHAYSSAKEAAAERMQDTAAHAYGRLQSNVAAVTHLMGAFKPTGGGARGAGASGTGGGGSASGDGASNTGAKASGPAAAPAVPAEYEVAAEAAPVEVAKPRKTAAGSLLASLPALPLGLPRLRAGPAAAIADKDKERPAGKPQRQDAAAQPSPRASKFAFAAGVSSRAARATRGSAPQAAAADSLGSQQGDQPEEAREQTDVR